MQLTREHSRCLSVAASFALLYAVMLFFCFHSPYAADDFCQQPVGLFDFKETWRAQWWQYLHFNSRLIAHLFDSFVLLRSEWVHIVCTPLAFIALVFSMEVLIWGKSWKQALRWWHPLLLFSLVWIFTPAFGQSFLWRTGAANYGYTTVAALLFLIPFRFVLDAPGWKPGRLLFVLLALDALCAGWSNENLGIVSAIGAGLALALVKKKHGVLPRWAFFLFCVCLAGWIVLILSPGNYARLALPAFDAYRDLTPYAKIQNYLTFRVRYEREIFYPLSGIVLVALLWNWHAKRWNVPFVCALGYFLLAQLSLGALLFSPVFAARSVSAASVFSSCACAAILLTQLHVRLIKYGVILVIVAYCAMSVGKNMALFLHQSAVAAQRRHAVQTSQTPVFERYYPSNSKYFYPNSLEDADTDWVNSCMRRAYNVREITLVPTKQ